MDLELRSEGEIDGDGCIAMMQTIQTDDSKKRFDQWWKANEQILRGMAWQLCRDQDQIEDLLQQTALNMIRFAGSFRGEAALKSWAGTILRNVFLYQMRTMRRRPAVAMGLDFNNGVEDGAIAAERLRKEQRAILCEALNAIDTEEDQWAIVMSLCGKSEKEIAAAMSMTLPAAKSRLYRARQAMKTALKREGYKGVNQLLN